MLPNATPLRCIRSYLPAILLDRECYQTEISFGEGRKEEKETVRQETGRGTRDGDLRQSQAEKPDIVVYISVINEKW